MIMDLDYDHDDGGLIGGFDTIEKTFGKQVREDNFRKRLESVCCLFSVCTTNMYNSRFAGHATNCGMSC